MNGFDAGANTKQLREELNPFVWYTDDSKYKVVVAYE